jgi:hypothetical protein
MPSAICGYCGHDEYLHTIRRGLCTVKECECEQFEEDDGHENEID